MELTVEQFLDRFGDVEFIFNSYYKYTFYFRGEVNGKTMTIRVGGDGNWIYKLNVTANHKYTVQNLGLDQVEILEDYWSDEN